MQINVVHNATPQLMNAMLFHTAAEETQNWLAAQYQQARQSMTDMGRTMLDAAAKVSQQLFDPNLMLKARSVMRKLGGLFHPNTILSLHSVEDVQKAQPIMQRYIMAMPEIRQRYHQQRLDGYSDSYVDHQPGVVGFGHYDYHRVMEGVVQTYEKEDEEGWRVSMYPDELENGDRRLEIDEQEAVWLAHEIARLALRKNIDPTDVLGGKLD